MRLERVELVLVALPLVRAFRTSFGEESVREAVLVHVVSNEGEGWGECGASREPLYSPDFNAAEWSVLADFFIPELLAASSIEASEVAPLLAAYKGHRMAKSALEAAVLDAELRGRGTSMQEYLGGSGDSVAPGVSVGMTPRADELLGVVASHLEEGYTRVKLKIEPGFDVEPTRAVRELVGDDFLLQVDANGAYRREDADHLARLDDLGLLLIEQPLADDDLFGHRDLAQLLSTPICLDESIVSLRSAEDALAVGACSIVNIKPARVGGYLAAHALHDYCRAVGVPVWCGGMLETGIGRAANLALASLPGFTLPPDISATDRYYREDVTAPFLLRHGTIAVPKGPGIGVEVDEAAVARLSTRRESFGR